MLIFVCVCVCVCVCFDSSLSIMKTPADILLTLVYLVLKPIQSDISEQPSKHAKNYHTIVEMQYNTFNFSMNS